MPTRVNCGGSVEDLAELPVPADQMQVLVEHRDALPHVIERGLQDFAVVVDRGIGVVEQLQRGLGRDRALAQQQRQHEPRRGRPDRRGEQMLGVAQQLEIRLRLGVEADDAARRVTLERGARTLLAEIARDRRRQFLDRHRRAPQPEARADRRQVRGNEHVGLQALDRRRRAREREPDIGEDVEREAPHHAVDERRQVEAEQRLRPQPGETPRPVGEDAGTDNAGLGEARQQQRVGPDQDPDDHAGERAAGGGAPPDQAAEERRRELRDRGERQEADRGELRIAGQAVIHVGEQQDREDRDPPHGQQKRADIVAAGDERLAPLQHQRHDDVVRHHDGERDSLDDHHGGRGRQPADKGGNREEIGSGRQRQRQHVHVAVDFAGRERQHAGERDRHHEQIDQHEIERKQPALRA